jgi:hypothetical protein
VQRQRRRKERESQSVLYGGAENDGRDLRDARAAFLIIFGRRAAAPSSLGVKGAGIGLCVGIN